MPSYTVRQDNAVIDARLAADAHMNNIGWPTHTELLNALKQALQALEISEPLMKHYPEPVARHLQAMEESRRLIVKTRGKK